MSRTLSLDNRKHTLPSVSVVIATRQRPHLLDRCLRALQHQSVSPSALIVVDNSAGDSATYAVARARNASYLAEPRGGVSRARNLGAREATSDVVAYLDDDAVPAGGWLASLLLEFRDPHVAAVTGRILELAEYRSGPHSRRAHGHEPVIFGGPMRITFDLTTVDWFEHANFGGIGQGANLAIRRNVFASWAGFDERLGAGTAIAGAEEHHAFFCLIDRGHRVVYAPAATVYHPSPATDAESRTLRLRQLRSASAHSHCSWLRRGVTGGGRPITRSALSPAARRIGGRNQARRSFRAWLLRAHASPVLRRTCACAWRR